MLVYCRNPLGYTTIDGKRIYGRRFARGSMPPVNLSSIPYWHSRAGLEAVPYTKTWLDAQYGTDFPNVSFVGGRDLMELPCPILIQIVRALGVQYRNTKNSFEDEKPGLVETIVRLLGD
jgi:hypothetical protein